MDLFLFSLFHLFSFLAMANSIFLRFFVVVSLPYRNIAILKLNFLPESAKKNEGKVASVLQRDFFFVWGLGYS